MSKFAQIISYLIVVYIIPILPMRKLGFREVKVIAKVTCNMHGWKLKILKKKFQQLY